MGWLSNKVFDNRKKCGIVLATLEVESQNNDKYTHEKTSYINRAALAFSIWQRY